jgi:hypothetical protein
VDVYDGMFALFSHILRELVKNIVQSIHRQRTLNYRGAFAHDLVQNRRKIPRSFLGRISGFSNIRTSIMHTFRSVGFFQLSSRIASGSRIPSGISLIYVLARFFSFKPYTARSRSFYTPHFLREWKLEKRSTCLRQDETKNRVQIEALFLPPMLFGAQTT